MRCTKVLAALLAALVALSTLNAAADSGSGADGGSGASDGPGGSGGDSSGSGSDADSSGSGSAGDGDSSGSGEGLPSAGSSGKGPGDRGQGAQRSNSSGRGPGGDDDEDDDRARVSNSGPGKGLGNLSKAQHEAREAFLAAWKENLTACRALNASEAREDCVANLTEGRKAFNEAQREAFEDAREAVEEAREAEKLGRFALAEASFVGRFVTFTWDGGNASVRDLSVGGCVLFERIALTGLGDEVEVEVGKHGRVVKIEAGGAKLKLHDNPGGVVTARAAENGTVVFDPDPSLNVTQDENGKLRLAGCGDLTATLHGHNLTWAGGVATFDRKATFVAHDDHPAKPAAAEASEAAVEDAKGKGKVGAEVNVLGDAADEVEEVELEDGLEVLDTEAGEGRVRVVVNATGVGPKTIVLNVAPGLLQGDRVVVRYYDEANGTFTEVPIARASGLEDVLDPGDDDGPEYWVVHGADGTQVLVSIESWSTHAFTVQGFLTEVPPGVLAGALGAVLVVAAAGAGLLRRKRSP